MEPAFVENEHLEITPGELWYGDLVTRASSIEHGALSRCLDVHLHFQTLC